MPKPNENLDDEQDADLLGTKPSAPSPTASTRGGGKDSGDEIADRNQRLQGELIELKRKQEELERSQRELEELTRKKDEFENGRRDILERLTRGLVIIERQEYEVRREAEQLELIRDSFNEQLSQVEAIKPEDWSPLPKERQAELTRALAVIDQANAVHTQARVRLDALSGEEEPSRPRADELLAPAEAPRSFGAKFMDGFAFSLPMILFGMVVLMILLSRS
jgi:chromosome segregation ATPase